eukprot:502436_1
MTSQHIDIIDKALGEYYKQKKSPYFLYQDNTGKFKKFCDDNGFEDGDVKDELQSGPQECVLVDFDPQFPFNSPIEDKKQRNIEIFNILQYCHANKKPPSYALKDFGQLNFSLANDKNEVNKTEKIYQQQCKGLIQDGQKQLNLCRLLTVGRLNKISLFSLLCDSFTRDRIAYYLKTQKILEINKWIELSPLIKKLKNGCPENKNYVNYKDFENSIKSAISLYFNRYNSKISFVAMETKINASVIQFAEPTLKMIDFINDLCSIKKSVIDSDDKKDDVLPAFQFDLMIIPKPAINTNDDEDDDTKVNEEADIIGDIEKRLVNCVCAIDTDCKQNELFDYQSLFRQFKQKINEKYSSDNKNNFNSFHQRRYCIAVDLRNEKRKLYMFEPNISNRIDKNAVDEHFMQLSYDSILPKGNTNLKPITAKNAESQVFILSFHVLSANKIKCYWYQRQQVSRFFPQDIVNLWPIYFVQENKDKNKMKKITDETKENKLIDKIFSSFYEQISVDKFEK